MPFQPAAAAHVQKRENGAICAFRNVCDRGRFRRTRDRWSPGVACTLTCFSSNAPCREQKLKKRKPQPTKTTGAGTRVRLPPRVLVVPPRAPRVGRHAILECVSATQTRAWLPESDPRTRNQLEVHFNAHFINRARTLATLPPNPPEAELCHRGNHTSTISTFFSPTVSTISTISSV